MTTNDLIAELYAKLGGTHSDESVVLVHCKDGTDDGEWVLTVTRADQKEEWTAVQVPDNLTDDGMTAWQRSFQGSSYDAVLAQAVADA